MFSLTRFKDIHKGETAVIIGNGQSLNQTPLDKLAARYKTFGSNKIYRLPFQPDYYCIIDEDMMNNCAAEIPDDFNPTMFIRAEAGFGIPIYPIVANGFSTDITNFVVMGGTVTYAMMQIAFYMGFTTLLLVGVDHHYPKTAALAGRKILGTAKDPDHFLPADGKPYFTEGKIFNAPELEGTAKNYAIAQELFTKAGREIINLTPGTKLNVFKKGNFKEWL